MRVAAPGGSAPVVELTFDSFSWLDGWNERKQLRSARKHYNMASTDEVAYAYCSKAVFFYPASGVEVQVQLGLLERVATLRPCDFADVDDMVNNLDDRLHDGAQRSVDRLVEHVWDVWNNEFAPAMRRCRAN